MKRLASALVVVAALVGCDANESSRVETRRVVALYDNTISMKHLMEWVVDPSADVIWGAVGTITTEQGEQQLAPRSDEEWAAVRNAAASVAESGNLLLMPGRARDQEDWATHARALTKTGRAALAAVDAKDTDALFTAGGEIYVVCKACHEQYALEMNRSD